APLVNEEGSVTAWPQRRDSSTSDAVPAAPRAGVAYLGHPNPRHLRADLEVLAALGCDDVLLAVQEIDFAYFPGKFRGLPPGADDLGLRPVALRWGALNLFGGGRPSQFLLQRMVVRPDHPACEPGRVRRSAPRFAWPSSAVSRPPLLSGVVPGP